MICRSNLVNIFLRIFGLYKSSASLVVLALGCCFILFYHQLDGIILTHSRCWKSPNISFGGSLRVLGLDPLGSQLGLRIKVS